jgi:hypothetical protein
MIRMSQEDQKQLIRWFLEGNVGESSKAIVSQICTNGMRSDYPYDPSDFARCYKLLHECPFLNKKFKPVMRKVSPIWKAYIKNWDLMTALYEREIHNVSGYAPELYDLMKRLREEHT